MLLLALGGTPDSYLSLNFLCLLSPYNICSLEWKNIMPCICVTTIYLTQFFNSVLKAKSPIL